MRRTLLLVLIFTAPFLLTAQTVKEEAFGAKEFFSFHRVLRPLQHTALPNADFTTIRASADTLGVLGRAIVALGVPPSAPDSVYANNLRGFDVALKEFVEKAQRAPDDDLRELFRRLHDTYEELAEALPR